MKKEILNLKHQGKNYNEIVAILGCAKSTVAYHCSKTVREKSKSARNKNRKQQREKLKIAFGGKCSVCNYNRCLSALDFHHINPKTKVGTVGKLHCSKGKKHAYEEAKKCILLCGNCHHELHSGIIGV